MTGPPRPDLPPDVLEMLDLLLVQVRGVLGDDELVGMYLFGSLALGDFDPDNSDLDVLMVTRGELPPDRVQQLRELHADIGSGSSRWAQELEIPYVPLVALREPHAPRAPHPQLDRGGSEITMRHHDIDWAVDRHVLFTSAVAWDGPPMQSLLAPVEPAELVAATAASLAAWAPRLLANPESMRFVGYLGFVTLTLCRVRYTLATGAVTTKPKAAAWARGKVPPEVQQLIDGARAWKIRTATERRATDDQLRVVTGFITDTLRQIGIEPPAPSAAE